MRRDHRSARTSRILAAVVGCLAGGLALTACSGGGSSLALQACVHVDASIHLYRRAVHDPNETTAKREAMKAAHQLAAAEQLAAQATSANPSFNPLMTTLQENGRTSEANLIPALRAQCEAARHPTSVVGDVPGTTPGTG